MDKKDKLKCYTLKANDGHMYTTCDDKSVKPKKKKIRLVLKKPKEAATDAMNAIKEVRNISGSVKLKKQFIERLKAEVEKSKYEKLLKATKEFEEKKEAAKPKPKSPLRGGVGLRPEISKLVQDFARPTGDIKVYEIFSVWSLANAIANNRDNQYKSKYDYSDKNIYNAFIKKVKELGGDYKNMSYYEGGIPVSKVGGKRDNRDVIGIKGKPRREVVTISDSNKGGLRQVEFVFPIKGYGGYVNYIISKQLKGEDEKFNEENFPSEREKKLAASIRKIKKFDKVYDKMEAMGFKEGYGIYHTGVGDGTINLRKGELFIPERVFNPSLADNYEFVNFLPLLAKK